MTDIAQALAAQIKGFRAKIARQIAASHKSAPGERSLHRTSPPDMEKALADVEAGRVERVCAPGKWVVWRDGEMVFSKVTNTESDPGSWADAIAHSHCLAVSDYVPPEEVG